MSRPARGALDQISYGPGRVHSDAPEPAQPAEGLSDHGIKHQALRDVARTLGVGVAAIYVAKYQLGRLLEKEGKRLEMEGR